MRPYERLKFWIQCIYVATLSVGIGLTNARDEKVFQPSGVAEIPVTVLTLMAVGLILWLILSSLIFPFIGPTQKPEISPVVPVALSVHTSSHQFSIVRTPTSRRQQNTRRCAWAEIVF